MSLGGVEKGGDVIVDVDAGVGVLGSGLSGRRLAGEFVVAVPVGLGAGLMRRVVVVLVDDDGHRRCRGRGWSRGVLVLYQIVS